MIELAWAAGFFDGEGNIHVGVTKHRWKKIVMTVAQAERTTLERFQRAVQEGSIRGPYRTNHGGRGAYYWTIEGPARCLKVIAWLWPYLSEPKRTQIDAAIVQWNTYQSGLDLRRHNKRRVDNVAADVPQSQRLAADGIDDESNIKILEEGLENAC